MTRDPRVYLAQILERAERIERYVADGEKAFQQDTSVRLSAFIDTVRHRIR